MRWSQATDVGRVRHLNEDSLCARPELGLFAVADGMGGHNAGEVASALAVQELEKYVYKHIDSEVNPAVLLEAALQEANRLIYLSARGNEGCRGMGTTITACLLRDKDLYIAHVGDSRAYLIGHKGTVRLTDDHSLVGELLRGGGITEEQAQTHPQRNVLIRALGTEPSVQVDIRQAKVSFGQKVLLCTDGLTSHLRDDEISNIVLTSPEPQESIGLLIKKALERGGTDNVTAILLVVD